MENQDKLKIRICAVVTGETLSEFIKNMKQIQQEVDLVELRIDYIRDIKKTDLSTIKKHLTKKAIITCRRKSNYEKGEFQGSLKVQSQIMQHANNLGFDYIDREIREYDQIEITNKKSKIILSYHNWEKTDTLKKLENLLNKMRKKEHDIIKIATMVKTNEDIKTLTKLLLKKKENEDLIIIGMGEKAKLTRCLAPLLGSYLTFVSAGQSSAPGQLDVKTTKTIYKNLGYNT